MTEPRQKCPMSDLTGDRHMVTDQRWTLTDPAGAGTVLCSPCCVIFWLSCVAPADQAQRNPTHGPQPHGSDEVAA